MISDGALEEIILSLRGEKTISKPDLKFEGPTRPLKVVQRGKVKLAIKVSERNNFRGEKSKIINSLLIMFGLV